MRKSIYKGSCLFQTLSRSNHKQVKRIICVSGRVFEAFVPTEVRYQGNSCGLAVWDQGSRMFTPDEVPPNKLTYYRGSLRC